MAVTKRREAERAVVRCALDVRGWIKVCLAEIERARNDDRTSPGAEADLENQSEALGSLLHAIDTLRNLPALGIDQPSPAVRDDATDTSRLAARRALPNHGTLRRLVYQSIRDRSQGMTDLELEQWIARSHQSISSARNSLVENGWLYDSGQRRAFMGSREAIVWFARPEEPNAEG